MKAEHVQEERTVAYDPETEMAWYVLKPFVNLLDFSLKREWQDRETGQWEVGPLPMNEKDDLERVLNRVRGYWDNNENRWVDDDTGRPFRPRSFTKRLYADCRRMLDVSYYRCAHDAVAQVGYGSYDRACRKLSFDPGLLGIEGKVRKFPKVGILLVGIDLDPVNDQGLKDANFAEHCVIAQDWLSETHFTGMYWEPSTSGTGQHGYLKVFYKVSDRPHSFLCHLHEVFARLADKLTPALAEIAKHCHLDQFRSLPTLVGVEKNSTITTVERDGQQVNWIHILKRSNCIKTPLFYRGIEDILAFHRSPWYAFEYMEALAGLSSSGIAGEENQINEEAQRRMAQARGGGASGEEYGIAYQQPVRRSLSHAQTVENLRNVTDGCERRNLFYMSFNRLHRRVMLPEGAMAAYEAARLNTGPDEGNRRWHDFARLFRQFTSIGPCRFDPEKSSVDYSEFDQMKVMLMAVIALRWHLAVKTYATCVRGKRSHTSIPPEEYAVIYYAMLKSQGDGQTCFFGYSEIPKALEQNGMSGGNRNKAAAFFKGLQRMKLARKVEGPVPGVRNTGWSVLLPEKAIEVERPEEDVA
ncbi:MAG TPA: hypothetical protein VHP11_13380 [Tepidisphaeraceae bacterium]|nr:hypothetical protein [Tepidisphaeraceae bacterium]